MVIYIITYLTDFRYKKVTNSSVSSSLIILSGSAFYVVSLISPFTRLYSFLVSVPHSITSLLIISIFAILSCCLYFYFALNANFVLSVLHFLQFFSLLLRNCLHSFSSSVNHGIDF